MEKGLVPGDSKTHPSGSNSWNRFSFTSPRFMDKKRFNERSKRFLFGQQPVKEKTDKIELFQGAKLLKR